MSISSKIGSLGSDIHQLTQVVYCPQNDDRVESVFDRFEAGYSNDLQLGFDPSNIPPSNSFRYNSTALLAGQRRLFFGNRHPFNEPVKINVRPKKIIYNHHGHNCGNAVLSVGHEKYLNKLNSNDASHMSVATSRGMRDRNQDGFYLSQFRTEKGQLIKVAAVLDGVGSCPFSEISVSGFLQGIHAYLQYTLLNQENPTIQMLYLSARTAMIFQNQIYNIKGNSTATIALVIGDDLYVCSVGDSALVLSRSSGKEWYSEGHSHVDIDAVFKNMLTASVLNTVTPHFYQAKLTQGDVVTIGTDGLWENILDMDAKFAMADSRQEQSPKNYLLPLDYILRAAILEESGNKVQTDRNLARHLHTYVFDNQMSAAAGRKLEMPFGLPGKRSASRDNVTAVIYQHGQQGLQDDVASDLPSNKYDSLLNIRNT